MSASATTWRTNFRVLIECTRCDATFQVDSPVVGTTTFQGKHQRLVTIYAPESCPECKSLHVVTNEDPSWA